jgi:hypothetical protein
MIQKNWCVVIQATIPEQQQHKSQIIMVGTFAPNGLIVQASPIIFPLPVSNNHSGATFANGAASTYVLKNIYSLCGCE